MPFYQIMIHSRPRNPAEAQFAKGAFTTRWVKAENEADAEAKLIRTLSAEYSRSCGWSMIDCEVQSIREVGFWRFARKQPGGGSTFYESDE
ncbi:MAG: hypothetical protein Q8S09_07405 [Hyphomonas sp.]|nr:hypothetical protein [Hyphomonas sp.]